eukprot:GHVN01001179.1.p1 GENE.GHVN01001179.1~~GHVN01001179.1.p1  ORF type:complete len:235 (+),score=9.64 GHVN01001179.1:228-932(+)
MSEGPSSPPDPMRGMRGFKGEARHLTGSSQVLPKAYLEDPVGENVALDMYNPDYTGIREKKHFFLSCALSGTLVAMFCTPFDVVKNHWIASPRLQANRYSISTVGVIKDIVAHHKIRGLWRGLTPSIMLLVPANIGFFYIYERNKNRYQPWGAGIIARTVTTCCLSPLEMLRTRVQANVGGPNARRYAWEIISNQHQRNGADMLRGLGITIARDVPFSAIYWTTYEAGKKMVRK